MNSKWFKRVVSAAGIAGGLLFFGAGAANAAIPVAGDGASTVSAQHIVQGPAGLVRPVGLTHAGDRFQPLSTDPKAESGLDGVAPSLGNPPTNGMRVDVPQLAGQVQQQAAPVTSKLGSLPEDDSPLVSANGSDPVGDITNGLTSGSNPLSGLTNGGLPEASTVTALPLSATSRVLPLSMPEDSTFTIAKGTQLPVDGVGNDVRQVSGTNLGSTVGETVAGNPSLPSESTESAVPAADNLAGGTNIAGLPLNATTPVLDQLAPSSPEDGSLPAELPAAPGSDPVSAVTGVVGNLADGQGLPGSLS